MRIGYRVDVDRALKKLRDHQERLKQVTPLVHTYGLLLQSQVVKNMSSGYHAPGTPRSGNGRGPEVVTGDLRRSVRLTLGTRAGRAGVAPTATVTSNAPQAWRLEKGFVGVDSAGRAYHQRPYPAWKPAADFVRPRFEAAMVGLGLGRTTALRRVR